MSSTSNATPVSDIHTAKPIQAQTLQKMLCRRPKIFSSSLSAASGAQTVTAPISLKIFGSFSPIGIISSTVVSPFITVFIYSGLLLILVSLIFPVLSKPSGFFINLQYTVITYIVNLFSHVPNFHL